MRARITTIGSMLDRIQHWFRHRKYREGRTPSRFVARDVRRDILIVSAAKLSEGIVTGRVRTTNLLYRAKGLAEQPEFGPPTELRIADLWH